MAQKLYDLVVTVGSYVDRNGNQKKEYETVGAVFQGDRGMYAILKKSFNPAGVASEKNTIFLNFYEPRDRNQTPKGNQAPANNQAEEFNDDIPW